jgi:electron transport complex protein RnfD
LDKLLVSTSPFLRDADSTAKIMWSVVLALAPAFLGSIYIFGYYAGLVTLVSVGACVACEEVIQRLRRVPVTTRDGSAAVTGMLLGFCLPPDVPLWVPLVGAVAGVGVAKQLFGGLGCNIWNPALVGRAVLQLSFPDLISRARWPILHPASPSGFQWHRVAMDIRHQTDNALATGYDAITQATPLAVTPADGIAKFGYDPASATAGLPMWLGLHPGSIGETQWILLAIGALALLLLRRIRWQVPVFFIGAVALMTWVLPASKGAFATEGFFAGYPLYHVAFGGLALGAFFMAADPVTTPLTGKGLAVFAVGCGALTAVIRLYGGYPEGVCYAILIMNTLVPVIDRFARPRTFGK